MTKPDTPTARNTAPATAERLLSAALPPRPTPQQAIRGAEQVFAELFRNLSRWVGPIGSEALFDRALTLAAREHPVLQNVRYRPQNGAAGFDRLSDNAAACGGTATADAMTAVIASIITTLTGLIGDENIAMSLIEERPAWHRDAGLAGHARDARHSPPLDETHPDPKDSS